MKLSRHVPLCVFGLLLLATGPASAEVRLPGFLGDHMVLQRQAPIPLWGWADPGEEVTVTLGENATQAVKATADDSGKWRVKLPAQEANAEGLTLTVSSLNGTRTISDVLVGEVWLCSGQSNMEWSVGASQNFTEEAAAATTPGIRHLKITHLTSGVPVDDVSADWQICSPETVAGFTAAGYFMARELHRELGVPIGLLNISWGGTRIEPWTPIEGFAATPSLADIFQQVSRTLPTNELYRAGLQTHIDAVAGWLETSREALKNGAPAPVTPVFPEELKPLTAHTSPTTIYNAMMHPVVGYGMRGAIWYQGESNHTEGLLYLEKKKALLAGWRELWGIGEFPFYFVQIAPYHYGQENSAILPVFWEAQSACLEIPNTGMVVTNDIGNVADIHPKNKQEVGRRLSLLALKRDYGKSDLVASGAVFEKMEIAGDTIRVHFTETAGGLKSRDGKDLTHFEIIGEQAEFVPAKAVIEGSDTLVLSADGVKQPAAIRFAWDKLAEPNLANGAGLPTSAFRAGEIPDYDFLALKVPESKAYELVYEMDLKQLSSNPAYEIDRSSEISGAFDRIGYFIELRKNDGELQWAWASMDPFTGDLKKIAIPTVASGAKFQLAVTNLNVLSNVEGLAIGENLSGNLEFWPHNYGPTNSAKVPGANEQVWDIGDEPIDPVAGYGSMQIHNTAAKQTVFAINRWDSGPNADLGIGNSSSDARSRDWTFSSNGSHYESARLRIVIRKVAN